MASLYSYSPRDDISSSYYRHWLVHVVLVEDKGLERKMDTAIAAGAILEASDVGPVMTIRFDPASETRS